MKEEETNTTKYNKKINLKKRKHCVNTSTRERQREVKGGMWRGDSLWDERSCYGHFKVEHTFSGGVCVSKALPSPPGNMAATYLNVFIFHKRSMNQNSVFKRVATDRT